MTRAGFVPPYLVRWYRHSDGAEYVLAIDSEGDAIVDLVPLDDRDRPEWSRPDDVRELLRVMVAGGSLDADDTVRLVQHPARLDTLLIEVLAA